MFKGIKADTGIKTLYKIPLKQWNRIKEIILYMAGKMVLIVKKSFPNATQVIDRFHVKKLVLDALH